MKKVILCGMLAAALLLGFGCAHTGGATAPKSTDDRAKPIEGAELTAFVEDEAAAKTLAELYGITLVSFSNRVAVYHTEEDPKTVIARGEKNGWPELAINRKSSAF